jgi:hypothetical protein
MVPKIPHHILQSKLGRFQPAGKIELASLATPQPKSATSAPPHSAVVAEPVKVVDIPVVALLPVVEQARVKGEIVDTLAESFTTVGQTQPISVSRDCARLRAEPDQLELPGGRAAPVSGAASSPMTRAELLSRAKTQIESCETSLRAAAEDIARAYEQGATQREVAQGVGKSPAWVNRLLKWRSSGYEGTAFGGKFVQGVNKKALPLEPNSAEPGLASTACTVLGENGSAGSGGERLVDAVEMPGSSEAQEQVITAAALASATKILSAAHAHTSGDYHIPAGLNRLDPERAFQHLAQQWSSSPFRDVFLDSPKAAQERFLRDVLLPERGALG